MDNPSSHRKDSLREVLSVYRLYQYKILGCSNSVHAAAPYISHAYGCHFHNKTHTYIFDKIDIVAFFFILNLCNKTLLVIKKLLKKFKTVQCYVNTIKITFISEGI